jgi:photosystem II stability/assembly factor-like uncharacterized protein
MHDWLLVQSPLTMVYSISMVTATNGWAVSCGIMHWDGAAWASVANPTSNCLFGIDMLTTTDGLAVGSLGTTIHWDGNAWAALPTSSMYDLTSVAMISSGAAWAVGCRSDGSTILRWTGTEWIIDDSPSGHLYAVAMSGSTDGWAVGDSILHYNGTDWAEVAGPLSDSLLSVSIVSPSDAWAVGRNGAIMRWDGDSWAAATSPTTGWLHSVNMTSSTDGWVVGNGGVILHWDGADWSIVPSPTSDNLFSVNMISSEHGWAGGVGNRNLLRYTEVFKTYLPVVMK